MVATMPRVDASIRGLSPLTSRYFLIEVAAVDAGSPAAGTGIAPGDLLVELGEIRLDGTLELPAVAALGIQGKPANLLVSRDGKPVKLRIQLERAREGQKRF